LELNAYSKDQLVALEQSLMQRYDDFKKAGLNLDLTRGKPAADQLDLSNAMEGVLNGNFRAADGTDVRNYGGLEGLPEMRAFGAQLLGVKPSETLAAGNSSLTLMYQYVQFCLLFGAQGVDSAWKKEGNIKFLCPVPGYDRHFTICEALGIEMLNVPMTSTGPDMDQVESMLKNDKQIKGIWCVPKYSNPSGEIYSDETVDRMAQLGNIAGANFRIMWDNAYTVHDLIDNPPQLANLMDACRKHGTEDSVCITGSTSKITMAGAGVAFVGLSETNLKHFCTWLSSMTIGPDKINQLRHARFISTYEDLLSHMKKHAALIKPKFDLVQKHLSEGLTGKGMGNWTVPQGGYFISFDTLNGLAKEVIKLTNEMGVKLTPAGSTFPYKKDPNDCNIRIAPTFPNLAEIDKAMPVFICAVELASVRQRLKSL
jgi:DNA-binding transcriptional MocR family regulator